MNRQSLLMGAASAGLAPGLWSGGPSSAGELATVATARGPRGGFEMVSRRVVLGLGAVGAGLVAGGGATAMAYSSGIAKARALVAPELSKVIPSRFGDLEYAEAGAGTPFLMVHGTGGGFDHSSHCRARRERGSGGSSGTRCRVSCGGIPQGRLLPGRRGSVPRQLSPRQLDAPTRRAVLAAMSCRFPRDQRWRRPPPESPGKSHC